MFSSTLHLPALEAATPVCIEAAGLLLYPDEGVLFIEGHPHPVAHVRELYLALVEACAAVHSHTSVARSWETATGIVEVAGSGFNIDINGVPHTPETVDIYTQSLREALSACPESRDL